MIAFALASAPVMACDTGPFAIEFPVRATHLETSAKRDLSFAKGLVQPTGTTREKGGKLEIAFYILDRRGRKVNAALWNARQREIEFYLKSIGALSTSYQIVFRPKSEKPKLSLPNRIQRTDVTINLVGGHC